MNDKMQSFLDDGLSVYVKARATLKFFEEEIAKLLLATAKQRQKGPYLESYKISPPKPGGGDSYGYWIAMSVEGSSHRKEQVKIDCGVWWNSPENNEPIIYASFDEEPKGVLTFIWNKQEHGIKSFDSFDKTFLYLPASKAADIGASLNLLLDELLKQLK